MASIIQNNQQKVFELICKKQESDDFFTEFEDFFRECLRHCKKCTTEWNPVQIAHENNNMIIAFMIYKIIEEYSGKLLNKCSRDHEIYKINNLLEDGADINFQTGKNEYNTALMLACMHGNFKIVRFLLEKKANVNLQNMEGRTALMSAFIDEDKPKPDLKKIVNELLKYGANYNIKDLQGNTALMHAINYDSENSDCSDIISLLLEKSGNIDTPNRDGITPLMQACINDNKKLVSLLLNKRAKINFQNEDGKTALMMAAKNNNNDIATFLMTKGANSELKNNKGQTVKTIEPDNIYNYSDDDSDDDN